MSSYSHTCDNGMERMRDQAALGPNFFTPDQNAFRKAAQGYDAGAAQYGDRQGHHAMSKLTYDPVTGSGWTNGLDATDDGYVELSQDYGRVTGAGRC
jgi:hypothetical protein